MPVGPVPAVFDVSGLGTSRLRWRYTSTRAERPAPGKLLTVRAVALCQPTPVDSRGLTVAAEPIHRTVTLPRRTARLR